MNKLALQKLEALENQYKDKERLHNENGLASIAGGYNKMAEIVRTCIEIVEQCEVVEKCEVVENCGAKELNDESEQEAQPG